MLAQCVSVNECSFKHVLFAKLLELFLCDCTSQVSNPSNFNYRGGTPLFYDEVADGSGNILLDDVECYGNELSLFDCKHASIGSHNCGHSEDFGVRCG